MRQCQFHLRGLDHPEYAPMIERFISNVRDTSGPGTHASDVSEAIWKVASDGFIRFENKRIDQIDVVFPSCIATQEI